MPVPTPMGARYCRTAGGAHEHRADLPLHHPSLHERRAMREARQSAVLPRVQADQARWQAADSANRWATRTEMIVMSLPQLLQTIESNPGMMQSQLDRLGLTASTISKQARRLETERKIRRVRFNNTYKLYPVSNPLHRATAANIRRSEEHRALVKQKVKDALTQNPRLDLQSLAKQIGCSYSIVSTPYHQFRKGEL